MAVRPVLTQKERLLDYLAEQGMARASELEDMGISRTAIARAEQEGDIRRVGRGLYQLPNAEMDAHASLAEVSKQAPNGVICLTSALAFHGLTDQMPRKVWLAVGADDWAPKISYPPIRIVRFREPYFSSDKELHKISGADVSIYSPAKTIADAFRNPKLVDRSVAIEALKSALADQKATPSALAKAARRYRGAGMMETYLEALTANG